jgi:hypothetical protein
VNGRDGPKAVIAASMAVTGGFARIVSRVFGRDEVFVMDFLSEPGGGADVVGEALERAAFEAFLPDDLDRFFG